MSDVDDRQHRFKAGDRVRCVMANWSHSSWLTAAWEGEVFVVEESYHPRHFRTNDGRCWNARFFNLLLPAIPALASPAETEAHSPGPTHAALNAEPDQSRMVGVVWKVDPR